MIGRRGALLGWAALGAAAPPPPGRVWRSPPRCYFTYPHCNGFLPSGHPVIAQRSEDGARVAYLDWDFISGTTLELHRTAASDVYWDVAETSGELVFVSGRRHVLTVGAEGGARELARPRLAPGWTLQGLVSVDPTGSRVLYAEEQVGRPRGAVRAARIMELDRASGVPREVCAMPFNADHPQYCPFDPSWIGFAHEGDIAGTLDRVWGLRDGEAPHALWDERGPESGVLLAGHERWAFHRAGALVVAYGSSPGGPTGLYFVDAASASAALVSPSASDWHCNISRDGRLAVVDSLPPRGQSEHDGRPRTSSIVVVDMDSGARRMLARSHAGPRHPWHPHPHVSPDGRLVVWNDFQPDPGSSQPCVMVQEIHG